MEKTRLGQTELMVSRLGFGGIPIQRLTENEAVAVVRRCLELGITFIDTAGGMLDNATITFKYLFQFPNIIPIPRIEKISEIEEIVGLMEGQSELTKADEEEMQRMREELGNRFCRRCEYCQPCPEGIRISIVMNSTGFTKRLPPERFFTGGMSESMEQAANCTECGECEDRCPYKLPIRDIIAERTVWYREEKRKYMEATAQR